MLRVFIFLNPLLAIGQQKKTFAAKGKGLAEHVKPIRSCQQSRWKDIHEMTTLFSGSPERYSPLKEDYYVTFIIRASMFSCQMFFLCSYLIFFNKLFYTRNYPTYS